MLILKKRYADKTIEEIAKESIELGYNTDSWTHKTARATKLRDLILIRLKEQHDLDSSNPKHFKLLIKLTDEVMLRAERNSQAC
jgi:hypothetical protein